MNEIEKLKILYDKLCKYKCFDYFSFNHKISKNDKITKWKFYNENNVLNILSFEQIYTKKLINNNLVDIIQRKWYLNKESNKFRYEVIDDIYQFIENNLLYIQKMTENYNNNIELLEKIYNIIGKYQTMNYNSIIWTFNNLKKTIDYIKIHINLFLDNSLQNITIIKKIKNKQETIELMNINEFLIFIKKIQIDIKKYNSITKDMEKLSIEDDSINTKNLKYEMETRNQLSNNYKNLFIKKKLLDRITVQSGKYKYELLENVK